jgi:hypothetical protein
MMIISLFGQLGPQAFSLGCGMQRHSTADARH